MDYTQIETARALATPVPHVISAADTSPAFVVQYVPTLGTSGTAATIALVQDGDMTFLVDGSAPAGADAIGTAGVIDTSAAAYDTIGELADYINGKPAWRCYLAASIRADGCEFLLAKGAASCFGDNGLTFYWDTSAKNADGVCISGEKFVNNGTSGHVTDKDDQCENRLLYAHLKLGLTGTGTNKFYACDQIGSTGDTLMVNITAADDSDNTYGGTYPDATYLLAPRGQRIVVRVTAVTSVDDYANFEVLGKTAVLTGERMVTEKNY